MRRAADLLWRDVAAGRIHFALIPVAPILLLPFILVGFVIVFPIWLASLILLGLLRLIAWLVDKALETSGSALRFGPPLARAFEWVKTFGGLAKGFGAAQR